MYNVDTPTYVLSLLSPFLVIYPRVHRVAYHVHSSMQSTESSSESIKPTAYRDREVLRLVIQSNVRSDTSPCLQLYSHCDCDSMGVASELLLANGTPQLK